MGSPSYRGTSARDRGFLKAAEAARHKAGVSGCAEGPLCPSTMAGGRVPERWALTVGESHRQPNGVGGVGVAVEDTARPLQREGGGSELPWQCRRGHPGHVGQQGWGSRR